MAHWLVKSEPGTYAFADLQRDGKTVWDGVRNPTAAQNLKAMKVGEEVLFYHSGEGKEVVGIAEVAGAAYPDPTADDPRWLAVDVKPRKALATPVSLATIKADAKLADIALVRRSRLSVVPVSPQHFARILELGETKL